ncbi:hypothetical protein WA026_023241 [Henosepilachna vigintioctopunctata]|uniref:C2H2-type domain-containing protein n=1 Tax=Henosepilachna vigintioctopunctata TaxID=420089 RepID=A0AAW1VJG2_9CUCU
MRQLSKNIRRSSVVMILASKIRNIKSNLRNYLNRTYGEGSKYPKDVRRYEKSKGDQQGSWFKCAHCSHITKRKYNLKLHYFNKHRDKKPEKTNYI